MKNPDSKKSTILINSVSIIAISLVLVSVIEVVAYLVNDEPLPLFINTLKAESGGELKTFRKNNRLTAVDPHLGYANGVDDEGAKKILDPHVIIPGFVVYSEKKFDKLQRPLIVTLGGSTSDSYMSTSVWVGELARLMKTNGISATIINGGVGGYSSSQELIKVIRDVVELEPDVVVTYDGINDVGGRYSSPPYRMVHPYQNRILNFLVSRDQESVILPNVIRMLRDFQISVGGNVGTVKSTIRGLPSNRTHADFWVRNLDMIHAICNQFGIKYVGILQPASGVYEIAKEHKNPRDVYIEELKSFYAEATMAVGTRSYLEDFSKVLLGEKGTYKPDGRHLTPKGDAIIAKSILDILIKKGHI